MAGRKLLDTNIFVYSFDPTAPHKQTMAEELISEALREGNCITSYQVVQEFLNVALRRFKRAMTVGEVASYLEKVLLPLCEVLPDARLYKNALYIQEETGWGFYDALIVSSAVIAGCDALITEDLQHGRVIRGVEIRNPFL